MLSRVATARADSRLCRLCASRPLPQALLTLAPGGLLLRISTPLRRSCAPLLKARDMHCTSLAETGRPHSLEVSRELRTSLVADCLRVLGRGHLLTETVLNL